MGPPGVEITGGPGSGDAIFLTLSFARIFAHYLWSENDHHFTVTRAKDRLTCDPKRFIVARSQVCVCARKGPHLKQIPYGILHYTKQILTQ